MIKESQRDPKDWTPHKGKFKLIKLPSIGPGSGVEQPSTKWVSKPVTPEWS
jgi:hypothetical protein